MIRQAFSLLWLATLGACGRVQAQADGAANAGSAGSSDAGADAGGAAAMPRLLPWQVQAEGSAPLVVGIFDSKERLHCELLPDSAGQLRCLPERLQGAARNGRFLDAACSQPIYVTDSAHAQGAEGRVVSLPLPAPDPTCALPGYTVGLAHVLANGTPYYGGAACVRVGSVVQPELESWLALDAEVPPERWVAGETTAGPSFSDRLRLDRFTTADGAVFDYRFFDARYATGCAAEPLSDPPPDLAGAAFCEPPRFPAATTFFDSGNCGGNGPLWRAAPCTPLTFIDDPGAGRGRSLIPFTLPVYRSEPGACRLYEPGPGETFYRPGDYVDDTEVQVTFAPGGGARLRPRGVLDASGSVVAVAAWLTPGPQYHDQQAQTDCQLVWPPDGSVRCVPLDVIDDPSARQQLFADASCTEPAYLCPGSTCEGRLAISRQLDARGDRVPDALLRLTALNAEAYYLSDGACVSTGEDFMYRGEPQPWDTLPALQEQNGRSTEAP